MSISVEVRAYTNGRERCREEARRKLGHSGPLPIGFDVARCTNPYLRGYRGEWRRGFDDERALLTERLGYQFTEDPPKRCPTCESDEPAEQWSIVPATLHYDPEFEGLEACSDEWHSREARA